MEPPNAQIEELITDFKARQWESAPLEKALLLATTTPESIASLVQRVMYALPRDGRFLDAALAFLPEGEWPELVRSAIEYMKTDRDNKTAEMILECAALQCVHALHPYLSDLFFLSAWLDNSYGAYAWRESEAKHPAFLPEFLHPVVLSTNMAEARKWAPRAFDALLETRLPEALKSACASYTGRSYTPEQLRYALNHVDFEMGEDGFRRLAPVATYHLQFPEGYVERSDSLHGLTSPSWKDLPTEAYTYRMGGVLETTCGLCHAPLHLLLTLDPIPEGLGVTRMPTLSLATCLSCMESGADQLYFQHDSQGMPSAYAPLESPQQPQFSVEPLLPTLVAINETPPRWRWQEWGSRSGWENLHRLGGHPSWVQYAEFPACPNCARSMPFLMQLDSYLKAGEGCLFWGSGGMGYLFWCDSCRISACTAQWT